MLSFGGERGALTHPKPMLLVGDYQSQGGKLQVVRQHRVRTDQELTGTGAYLLQHLALLSFGQRACQQSHVNFGASGKQLLQGRLVLTRQNFGRCHHNTLPAVANRGIGDARRHGGFAAADISLQQAVHRSRAAHIPHTIRYGTSLCPRQGKRKCGQYFGRIIAANLHGGFRQIASPDAEQAELKQQQFFKNQPPTRALQCFAVGWKMNVLNRIAIGAKSVFLTYPIGQAVTIQ